MDKQRLKNCLRSIKENDYKVPPEENAFQLSLLMMDYIGDIDAELRDQLILSTLYKWIIDGTLDEKEVYQLFEIALDENHLLKGLGSMNDTVFTRTFSIEVIALSIIKHRNKPFIAAEDIQKAFNAVLRFYNEDNDVRGYVEGKGWAHGAAHGADAIDEFARCEEIGYEGLHQILKSIRNKVYVHHYGYIHFEDERMITPVKGILARKVIPLEEMEKWIKSFRNIEKVGKNPEDLVIEFNVNIFLKSLYFRLIDNPEYAILATAIKDVLQAISRFKKY